MPTKYEGETIHALATEILLGNAIDWTGRRGTMNATEIYTLDDFAHPGL